MAVPALDTIIDPVHAMTLSDLLTALTDRPGFGSLLAGFNIKFGTLTATSIVASNSVATPLLTASTSGTISIGAASLLNIINLNGSNIKNSGTSVIADGTIATGSTPNLVVAGGLILSAAA